MTPDASTLLISLLPLLLPGFISMKIWERFFPKTNSQKQDEFDKIATYLTITLFNYAIALPFINFFLGSISTNNFIVAAYIAIIVGSVVAVIGGLIITLYNSRPEFTLLRNSIDAILPFKSSIWHKVFHIERVKEEQRIKDHVFVKVAIYMKSGKVFTGEMDSYPLEDNIEDTKDFILKGVETIGENKKWISYPEEFRLLLNQRDVDAIFVEYVSKKRIDKAIKARKKRI